MKPTDRLLDAYRELEALNRRALEELQKGLDLATLNPVFERKAALSAFISDNPIGSLQAAPEALKSLLEAQSEALNAESRLGQALQSMVSSFENMGSDRKNVKSLDLGRRWDYSG